MHPFKKMILQINNASVNSCVHLDSFEYKGGEGYVTFQYTPCGGGATQEMTFSNLFDPGGTYTTHSVDSGFEPYPCYVQGTLVKIAGVANVTNFITSPC